MHIGFVSIESPVAIESGGGIAAYLRAIAPALAQAGHQVTIIANTNNMEQLPERQVRIVPVRLPSLHWYLSKIPGPTQLVVHSLRQIEWSLCFYRTCKHIFSRYSVEVIEGAEIGTLFLATNPIAPLIVRLHGSDYIFHKYTGRRIRAGLRWSHYLERLIYRNAVAISSPSQYQASEIASDLGWSSKQVKVIPNSIAMEILQQALQHPIAENAKILSTILYVGRLAPVKGVEILVEAVKQAHQAVSESKLILVGGWQMPDPPEQFDMSPSSINNANNVWLGHLPWQRLVKLYLQAAVFVMPSYYETFGISVIEAMAFSLPVVATNGGGLPEVVENGVTGLLIPPGNRDALAGAITRLLQDKELEKVIDRVGQERAQQFFNIAHVVGLSIDVYKGLMVEDNGK